MSNNTNIETKAGGKKLFDKISAGALKIEMVVMFGILLTCAFKVTTTFIL